jgi:transposase-like protein
MEEYPRTLLELEDRFSTEEACRGYLRQLRWPEGFVCPRCQGRSGWPASRGRVICQCCRHQASVTAGTVFQDTRKPLRLWFRAIWYVTSQKNGTSAVSIQQILGLGSYLTAWTWLHKLRRAMVRPGRDRLSGRVEVDETYVGGQEEGSVGRRLKRRALVVIAAEEDGRGMGRIRMARVPDATKKSLQSFVTRAVELGSLVHTDGFGGYRDLEKLGYQHDVSVLLNQEEDAAIRMLPRVHRVAALLKRWLLGTHQGAVRPEHLDYYLDEFTFRFNRRKSRSRLVSYVRCRAGRVSHSQRDQTWSVSPAAIAGVLGIQRSSAPRCRRVRTGQQKL